MTTTRPLDESVLLREAPEAQNRRDMPALWRRFCVAYARHRAAEGRGSGGEVELLALPYLAAGPLAREWAVRARSFDLFIRAILTVRAREIAPRTLRLLDLGAGNGWLCYRVQSRDARAIALDMRSDAIDGLAAAAPYRSHLSRMFPRITGSFDALPLERNAVDIAVFNASIHYALDLSKTLEEAARVVVPGGRVVIMDSPFYDRPEAGELMVAEKRRNGAVRFGDCADDLLALPFVEFLTGDTLREATRGINLNWRRHRVRYPLWYEARPVLAFLRRQRRPSRFDVWEATVP